MDGNSVEQRESSNGTGVGLPWVVASLGVISIGLAGILSTADFRHFLFSYLVAFLFYLSLGLGTLFFVLLHHTAGATWSVILRRVAENIASLVPVFLLLVVPLLLGMSHIFDWTNPEYVAEHHAVAHKASYLNRTFLVVRTVVGLGVLGAIALWFRRTSVRQDSDGDVRWTRVMQKVSPPCLVVFAFTTTSLAFDWIMSLEPKWFSTMFGVYYFSGAVLSSLALLAVATFILRNTRPLNTMLTEEHLHNLGKLLFAFVCFWAYIAFSQYLLIWYANLPEETFWYGERLTGSWYSVSILLAVGHFVVPFFFLLGRRTKRAPTTLVLGAIWVLVMHYLDIYWLVMPSMHEGGARLSLLDGATVLGLGGVLLGVLIGQMRRAASVPVRDPYLDESLVAEG